MVIRELAFYPTLFYNVVRNKLSSEWAWFSRIDETVILGALPFKSMIPDLTRGEKVGGVVCLNQPHEMNHEWVAKKEDWETVGVDFYWLPVPDFDHSASAVDIEHAVKFIGETASRGKSVYVHCKAGRTRSSTVVACYLMKKNNLTPDGAIQLMKEKRHQIILRRAHYAALDSYHKLLTGSAKPKPISGTKE